MNQYLFALITGVTTGGLSCFAIRGGLLASAIATNPTTRKLTTTNAFFLTKTLAIVLLGGALGLLGDKISLTPTFQGYMQILAGLFMVITALRLLDIHPFLRKFQIAPPKWAFRFARKISKDDTLFAPAFLGFTTVLIPCGITQSMMLLAISSANFFSGALIMGLYTLGTAPVFYGLGIASGALLHKKSFLYLASLVIFAFGATAINTGQVLRGSVHTFQNYYVAAFNPTELSGSGKVAGIKDGVQQARIDVITGGYKSDTTQLKAGVPVSLELVTSNTQGCSRAFTIPSLNYSQVLSATGTEKVEFTPTEKGRLVYTCSMGMYTGYFDVI